MLLRLTSLFPLCAAVRFTAVYVYSNICHGSDAVESANKEIALWFTEAELCQWTPAQQSWVYESA